MMLKRNLCSNRFGTMMKADFRRMFKSRLFYIMTAICIVMPILIIVMTSMMAGSVTVDPQTGAETVIEGMDNVWQIIGSVAQSESTDMNSAAMNMSITSMCNINMLYFLIAVFVCIFVSDDFRSGYAKNIFSVRSKKTDYVFSKTLVGFVGGAFMLVAFFVGSFIGGSISGLSFEMTGFGIMGLFFCMASKIVLVPMFASLHLCMSVIGKQKLWLSMLLSLCTTMFLFMTVSMVTPLNSTVIHFVMCVAGSIGLSFVLGATGNKILKSTALA